MREIAKIECKLGEFFSDKTLELLKKHSNLRGKIKAIGTHGHTLYHMPENPFPYSLQVGGASIINARTGIKTICDFRSTDIAYGGEGAPLVPAFHQWAFSKPNVNRIIINLGGIANITILSSESGVLDSIRPATALWMNGMKKFNIESLTMEGSSPCLPSQ